MSRRGMPVYPGDVIICRRSCAEPWSCLFAVHFLPHDVTFTIYRWCQAPSCGGPKCTQILTVIIFCWSRDTTLFCAKLITPNSYLCIYNKNVARLSGIVARLTATTAILSRICRYVWVGTFGICRSHARAPVPMQTNTLGTSRCTDRYIRDTQTSAPNVTTGVSCRKAPRQISNYSAQAEY